MKVTRGWTIELAEERQWYKNDVVIEDEDVDALFESLEVPVQNARLLSPNDRYRIMSNEADKFILLDQMTRFPAEFRTEENKARLVKHTETIKQIVLDKAH